MKTEKMITVRAYPVEIRDERTGEKMKETIVLDKDMLRAAATIGMGDEDLIYRLYNRKGYRVFEIGKPVKKDLVVDLDRLYWYQIGKEVDEEYSAAQEHADDNETCGESGATEPGLMSMG